MLLFLFFLALKKHAACHKLFNLRFQRQSCIIPLQPSSDGRSQLLHAVSRTLLYFAHIFSHLAHPFLANDFELHLTERPLHSFQNICNSCCRYHHVVVSRFCSRSSPALPWSICSSSEYVPDILFNYTCTHVFSLVPQLHHCIPARANSDESANRELFQ